jgi:hypothetical protein
MRITSCENIFSACNRSSSSRLGTLHLHRRRHHGGGERCTRTTPSKRQTTERKTAVRRHLHFLRVPPSLRARSRKAPHGVSISTICAKGIVNITHLALLLVEIHFTRRQISRSRRTRSAPNFVRNLRNILLAATATYRKSFTGGLWSVGGSLLGCCCWSGAAALVASGYMRTVLAREKTFTLHHRELKFTRIAIRLLPNLVRIHLLPRHTKLRAAHLICLFPRPAVTHGSKLTSRCQLVRLITKVKADVSRNIPASPQATNGQH